MRPSPNFVAALAIIACAALSAVAYGLLVYHVTRTFN